MQISLEPDAKVGRNARYQVVGDLERTKRETGTRMTAIAPAEPVAAFAAFPDDSCGDWHVLRTKSRQEKVLASQLAACGTAQFLPVLHVTRYYAGRKAVVEQPMFPGYLFLRGDRDAAFAADRTRRVAQIIPVRQQDELTRELRNIYLALSGQAPLDVYPYLQSGVRVEVRDGPFRGLQGLIESRTKRDRLILQVDILGRAVSLEIEPSLLDVLE